MIKINDDENDAVLVSLQRGETLGLLFWFHQTGSLFKKEERRTESTGSCCSEASERTSTFGVNAQLRRRSGGNGCSRDSRLPAITERRAEDAAAEMDRPSQPLSGS
ncbi:hypothetical protein AOLI_G00064080 [Acnodon oligacanthus]